MIKIIAFTLLLFIIESLNDTLVSKGLKKPWHAIQLILFVNYMLYVDITGIFEKSQTSQLYFLGYYILIRYALFDIFYNLMNKLPVFYVGKTSLTDTILRLIPLQFIGLFVSITKTLSLFISIILLDKFIWS